MADIASEHDGVITAGDGEDGQVQVWYVL